MNELLTKVEELNKELTNVLANRKKRYKWVASSDDDGLFEDDSRCVFDEYRDAYDSMRNAALEKMKWNTELNDFEDYCDLDENYISYEVKFFKDKIIHTSYSGTYTYKIIEVF